MPLTRTRLRLPVKGAFRHVVTCGDRAASFTIPLSRFGRRLNGPIVEGESGCHSQGKEPGHGHRHGNGHSNGKRWLLIGLLVLGGFWLVNDAYSDGFRDAMVQTGQAGRPPDTIGVVPTSPGAGDPAVSATSPGARAHSTASAVPAVPLAPAVAMASGACKSTAPPVGGGAMFCGPRAVFEQWHRDAHEASGRGTPRPRRRRGSRRGRGLPREPSRKRHDGERLHADPAAASAHARLLGVHDPRRRRGRRNRRRPGSSPARAAPGAKRGSGRPARRDRPRSRAVVR